MSPEEFDSWYESRGYRVAWRQVRKVKLGHDTSEDVVGDAYIAGRERIGEYDPTRAGIAKWFETVVFNEIHRQIRRLYRARARFVPLYDGRFCPVDDEPRIERDLTLWQLRRLAGGVELEYLSGALIGEDMQDTARRVGCSRNTIRAARGRLGNAALEFLS